MGVREDRGVSEGQGMVGRREECGGMQGRCSGRGSMCMCEACILGGFGIFSDTQAHARVDSARGRVHLHMCSWACKYMGNFVWHAVHCLPLYVCLLYMHASVQP